MGTRNIIYIFALGIFFSTSGCTQEQESPEGPYTQNISSYPKNWKGRSFKCATFGEKYGWIPEFTLAPYSNPNDDDFEELCSCIDKEASSWVRDTVIKLKNKEEVSWMHKRGFPSSFGGTMNYCTKNK